VTLPLCLCYPKLTLFEPCQYLVPLLVIFAGCGDDKPTSPGAGLNTESHNYEGGFWPDSGIIITEGSWRFISAEENDEGGLDVRGAYKVNWANNNTVARTIDYWLFFLDAEGFQIAEYPVIFSERTLVDPNSAREVSGNFIITVANVSVANSITSISVTASFSNP